MAFILTDVQLVEAQVSFVDGAGNPASAEAGSVAWSSSDESVVTVTVDPSDETKAVIVAAGPLGTAQVSVSADADLGAGIQTITGTVDIEVQASQAVSASIALGSPQPKP